MIIWTKKYNLNLSRIMSFNLVAHLQRLAVRHTDTTSIYIEILLLMSVSRHYVYLYIDTIIDVTQPSLRLFIYRYYY